MSTPIPGGAPGGAPARDRFVGIGLALVVLGWLALAADLALASAQLQVGSLVAVLSLKADIATLAETLIVTGLGLAILGGLREGFGALNRFFDAVLQRSTASRPAQAPTPEPAAPVDLGDAMPPPRRGPAERSGERAGARAPAPPAPSPLAPALSASPFVSAPATPGRNYQILPDGSVEVETLLGTRVFASMEEARDFIR